MVYIKPVIIYANSCRAQKESQVAHVAKTVRACFAAFVSYAASAAVPRPVLLSLVSSLILSWLDYGNGSLVDIPLCQLERLQELILLPGWCFPRRCSTTSPRSSASCTGSKYRSGL